MKDPGELAEAGDSASSTRGPESSIKLGSTEHEAQAGGGFRLRSSARSLMRCGQAWLGTDGPAGLQPPLEGEHVVLAVAAVPTEGPHRDQPAAGGQPAQPDQRNTESIGG